MSLDSYSVVSEGETLNISTFCILNIYNLSEWYCIGNQPLM